MQGRLLSPFARHTRSPLTRVASSSGYRRSLSSMSSAAASAAAALPAQAALHPLPHVAQLSPRVLTVLGQNPGVMTLQGTNTYIIGTGKSRILLDTGEGVPAYLPHLRSTLESHGVTSLSAILLSHWHHDHTGGLADVLGLGLLEKGGAVHKAQGSKWMPAAVMERTPALRAGLLKAIKNHQKFETEGASLTALHTPGHTEDHTCFLLSEEQAVFSGDTILGAGTAVFSDLHSYMHSLRTLHRLNPRRLYPAHGPILDAQEAPARIQQYMDHRMAREEQIIQALRDRGDQGKLEAGTKLLTTEGIVAHIYTGVPPALLPAATCNALLHLDKLVKEGKVMAFPQEASSTEAQPATHPDAHAAVADADADACASEAENAIAAAAKRAQWRWKLV